jgi:hypothetical protein
MITKDSFAYTVELNGLKVILPIDTNGKPNWGDLVGSEFETYYNQYALPIETVPSVTLPKKPNPAGFLKHCFSGEDPALFTIFTKVFQMTLDPSNIEAARWYDQMVAGAAPHLFVLTNPPATGGFGLAVNELAIAAELTSIEKDAVRQAFIKFGFPSAII